MKKYHVDGKSFHPDVRFIGRIIRFFSPDYSEKIFNFQNKILDKILKGRWLSLKTVVETRYIEREDGSKLRVLVCKSKKNAMTDGAVTGLLWLHGGGYAIGLPEQDFLFADLFCEDGGCVAVLPDYTKSTYKPYPVALQDAYLCLKWMYQHTDELNIKPNQLFVGGDSAGGGLAVALCLYARDKKEVPIAFQMPLYPMIDDREITASSKNNDAPVWNTKSNRLSWSLYLKGVDSVPIYAAPSRATDLNGLPACLTYIGTIEPFYDETILYC